MKIMKQMIKSGSYLGFLLPQKAIAEAKGNYKKLRLLLYSDNKIQKAQISD